MKSKVIFTRKTAIAHIKTQLSFARQARQLNCNRVANEDYERAQFLVSFFNRIEILDDNDFERFWDEISVEKYDGKEVTF